MKSVFYLLVLVFGGCATSKMIPVTSDISKDLDSYACPAVFQLSLPVINIVDRLFSGATEAEILLNYPETTIYYTLDGSEPTQSSKRYTEKVTISKSGTLSARAFHPEHKPSASRDVSFLKINKTVAFDSIQLNTLPHENYKGGGVKTLFDYKKGSRNFRTNEWLGFNGDDVEAYIVLNQVDEISEVTVCTLTDASAWIFPPSAIEFWAPNSSGKFDLIATKSFDQVGENVETDLMFLTLDFDPIKVKELKVVIRNNGPIPNWHNGKGMPAWLFLDEIVLQ